MQGNRTVDKYNTWQIQHLYQLINYHDSGTDAYLKQKVSHGIIISKYMS